MLRKAFEINPETKLATSLKRLKDLSKNLDLRHGRGGGPLLAECEHPAVRPESWSSQTYWGCMS
jgi:hypothetical protein